MEKTLRHGRAKIKCNQAEGDHPDEVAEQGQRNNGGDQDEFFPHGAFDQINIEQAEGKHGDERAETAAGFAHIKLVAADG